MNQTKLAEIGITPFSEQASGYRITFSDLINLSESVMGKRIEDAVKDPLGDRYQDNIRQFWNRHIDDYASEGEEESFCFRDTVDGWLSQFRHHFGADWSYSPANELNSDQVKILKNDGLWSQYLYFPAFLAMADGLDEAFGAVTETTVFVNYDW